MHNNIRTLTRRLRGCVPVMGALLAASSRLLAQAPTRPSDSTKATLGPVVVSATRATTTLDRVPLHATVIGRAEIMQSPARTLDQLLRDIPGMNIPGAPYYTTDPTGQQTKLRGVTNSKVLMLVDGVPIHDPFYSTTQWFKVPLSAIERIEVLRGGSSSVWGNLAVAGVVNIVTRKPIDNSAQADISYQSFNTTNAAVAKNFALGGVWGIRVSGDVLRTDGYQTTPDAFLSTVPGKGPSSAKNGNAQVAVYYTPAGSFSGFFRAGYHEQNEDVGGYRFGTNLQKSPDAAAGFTRYLGENTRAEVRAWGQYESFDKSNGAGCYLAAAANCNTTATTAPLVQYANSRDDNPYRELGASATLATTDLGASVPNLEAGADFRTVGGEDRAITYNRPTTADVASATINRTNFGRGTQRFFGGFAQLKVTPTPRLETTWSLRYDYWTNTGGVSQMTKFANGVAGTTLGGAVHDSHEGSLNPSLAARFEVTSALSLRGAAYRAFRAPGLNNLYRSFSSTTSITIANPGLRPETLTGAEVGADYRLRNVTLGATAFQYNTSDLIASYKIPNAAAAPEAVTAICGTTLANCPASVNFNTNGQDAISRGLELTGKWRVASAVSVDGSYTYTDSHYSSTTTGDPTNAQLGAVPANTATLGASWQPTRRWTAFAGARFNGDMFLDVNHTIHQAAFTLFDASTSYRANDRFEIYGSITNLTGARYADNATTSAAGQLLGLGRALTSGIRYRFW
ncbi:MAG TPA: TonB-dependent receptor [Gemmatimonadaceae bacterium]|nr:TonB-dependent receptor [Gemmatimonadaceae bacterium]